LPPPPPRPAPPLLRVEVVPGGVVLVAGVVVEVVGVVGMVGMVGVVGVVVDEVGAGVEVVLVAVLVAVLVLLVLLLVVLVGVVLVVALGWLGVAVVAGSWQSWAASRPTVLAPWSRLRRNVGPIEGGSSATRLLKLVIAVRAALHWRALTAEETAASCALRLEDSAPLSRPEPPPQVASSTDTAKPSPTANNARSAVRIRGLTLETRPVAFPVRRPEHRVALRSPRRAAGP